MRFINPYCLLLIPAAGVIAAALFVAAERKKRGLLRQILGERSEDPRAVHLSRAGRAWKHALLIAAMLLFLFAAARPYLRSVPCPTESRGRDILVLFDVSKSMRATDLPPSRMAQAKYLLSELIAAHPGDRFGIVPFAGNAFLSCPLTADRTALREAVDDLSTESVPLGGTDVQKALATAMRAFAGAEGGHRAILLLTDGDELTGKAAAELDALKKAGIPVAVAGFGDPALEAPVPDGKGGVMRDASGKPAASRLNEAGLRAIASATGGVYVRSQATDTGFPVLNDFLDRLDAAAFAKAARSRPDDLFAWFIAAAALVLFAAAVIPERGAGRAVALLLAAWMFFPEASGAEKALELPNDPRELYAQGRKLQVAGDAASRQYYEKAVQSPDASGAIRAAALQNLGVLTHTDGREQLTRSKAKLREQNPDEALKTVEAAEKRFAESSELYARSMEFSGVPGSSDPGGANYRQLLLDKQEAEKLKKELEELKKRQQQAQQQTQQAQQRNQQQNQQQQNQQQNQQQGQQSQQQQGRQGQQDRSAAKETQKAQQAAKELAEQAEKLDQKQLSSQARQAEKKLDQAREKQERGDGKGAQKDLDDAARTLGRPESSDKKDDTKEPAPSERQPAGDKPEKKGSAAGERNDGKSDRERAAERQLDRLNDETDALREAVRTRRNSRRPPVEKDW